jgi:hypothetical protein
MAQSGFTPVQHYRSATAAATPSAGNLVFGELALNYFDGNLFFKDASNIVRLLASTAAATGTVSSVQASGGTTGLTFSGGPVTTAGTLTLGGTLAVANGGTGVTTSTGSGSTVLSNSPTFGTQITVSGPVIAGTASGVSLQMADNSAIRNTSTAGNTLFFDSGVGVGSTGGDFSFRATASFTSRVYINGATGNVGIGTTSPESNLDINGRQINRGDVNGFVFFAPRLGTAPFGTDFDRFEIIVSPSTAVTTIGNRNGGTGAARALSFMVSGTDRMRIDTAGNVGIGETAPDYKLDVNGTFGFTPGASVTPVDNGDVVFELTNNTTLTIKARGSDGVVRSGTITLA